MDGFTKRSRPSVSPTKSLRLVLSGIARNGRHILETDGRFNLDSPTQCVYDVERLRGVFPRKPSLLEQRSKRQFGVIDAYRTKGVP